MLLSKFVQANLQERYLQIPSGSPWRRWEDNIRKDLKEIGINTRNWVVSAQDSNYLSSCECGIESAGSISHGVCRDEG